MGNLSAISGSSWFAVNHLTVVEEHEDGGDNRWHSFPVSPCSGFDINPECLI